MKRRGFLGAVLGSIAASACGAPATTAPAPPKAQLLPPLDTVGPLHKLLPLAKLRWLILARPREIASLPALIPPIGLVVPEENLNRFAASTGVDLRQIPEAAVALYAEEKGAESMLYLARHNGDPATIERLFRARLIGGEHRAEDRPDLIRLSGKLGLSQSTLVLIGRDILGVQQGGSPTRGAARIAGLYAEGKLKKSPSALAEEPLRSLAERFGDAPIRAFAPGPFEGELQRGARGLLAGATAIGAAARPSARDGIALSIAVAGDFSKSGDPASRELGRAWDELAKGSFGHLLGLDQPVEAPLLTFSPTAVACAVELDPQKLARGLRDATSAQIAEIMR
ncbi:MAG: hypothetical protein U0359_30910 [Byssovorax sp.]